MSKRKPNNRCGKSSRLSGSTMRLLDRISAGLGKSYMEQQKEARRMAKNVFRKGAMNG